MQLADGTYKYSVRVRGPLEKVHGFTTLAVRSGATASPVGSVTEYLEPVMTTATFVYRGPYAPEIFEAIAAAEGLEVLGVHDPQ